MKILLVDDDTFLLDMYAVKFNAAKHTVDTEHSVESALEKLRGGETYDAILLDMVMPGLTGLDFLRTIKSEKLVPTAALIVLSNQGDDADVVEAKKEGAHGYIVKAHTIPSEVVETVEKIVEESGKQKK